MNLSDDDYRLSMRISPRGASTRDGLRSLLIHRLRPTPKAVLRLPNSRIIGDATPEEYSLYCGICEEWFTEQEWDDEWECPACQTVYGTELVVFSAIGKETI